LLRAEVYQDAGMLNHASFYVGIAIHGAQDFTSPEHTDATSKLPLPWNPPAENASLFDKAKFYLGTFPLHVAKEFFDPGADSNLQRATQDVIDLSRARTLPVNADGVVDFTSRWGVDAPWAPTVFPPLVPQSTRPIVLPYPKTLYAFLP